VVSTVGDTFAVVPTQEFFKIDIQCRNDDEAYREFRPVFMAFSIYQSLVQVINFTCFLTSCTFLKLCNLSPDVV